MTQDTMNNQRYRLIQTILLTILLTMLLPGSNVMAQSTPSPRVKGNVYGGGNLADVQGNTEVNISAGTVAQNVYGGGKGSATTFKCEKAMVGINEDGLDGEGNLKAGGTSVTISGGTVKGNVYGGGEIGRVERNTQVTIGDDLGTGSPVVEGYVFGAGKGVETHGYSALVRGNSTVTVQGNAKIGYNVYGGGENSTVGRYWVKGINNIDSNGDPVEGAPTAPDDLPVGMPYQQQSGGICRVTIQGNAVIGESGVDDKGHVFGAGKGVEPHYVASGEEGASQKMVKGDAENPDRLVDFTATSEQTAEEAYLEFLQTLSLVTNSYVTIDGSAQVKGSVFGGSESGFVQTNTNVTIQGSGCVIGTATYGNVFGGGKGLEAFAEAGKVKGNTTVTISDGTIKGNVYGGGRLGDVGIIDKTETNNGQLTYNYYWKQNDGSTANVGEHNTNATATNTGICTVTITGGEIGTSGTVSTEHGNVFGAGRGSSTTWWCEKAIAYATSVTVSGGTVNGTVYGGGEVGRVEDDAKVVIGVENATGDAAPTITGSVFGAGAGLATHGYSALVRGNAAVTVQGTAQVGGSVYGGGETASVGKFNVVGGLPTTPLTGGNCTVEVKDHATIGTSGTDHNVYGACKGVTPAYVKSGENRTKSMQLLTNAPSDGSMWSHYNNDESSPFIWRYYATEADYLAFLKTLALTSHPTVTVGGSASVYGSVFGGGQRGVTLGRVGVNITGGTIEQDVYGGGALADTNCGNWDVNGYVAATGLTVGTSSVTGLYTRTETDGKYTYTLITDEGATAESETTYYRQEATWTHSEGSAYYTTTVSLTGGLVKGDAYGGGLGQKTGFNSAESNIEAVVWGDIAVTLNGTAFDINYYTDEGYTDVVKSGRVFGCNNLLGSPQGNVTVTVNRTVEGNTPRTEYDEENGIDKRKSTDDNDHSYELAAVYGGGNLAPYTATGKKAHVIINGCGATSILTVYGGGNAAAVPETDVDVNSCFEIGALFGGGNGKDKYKNDSGWKYNAGANVNGNANTMIYGGTVHEAYGGSNEKGTITGNVTIDVGSNVDGETCTLDVAQLVGAGKNADVNGDLKIIMGCKPSETIPLVFGGANNANVNGDVELTITSGNFGQVFGGNNDGGCIKGHIYLNIEETTCIPINIDHLYLCGNNAAYSQYGYYVKTDETEAGTGIGANTETAKLSNGKLQLIPRESATDTHLPVDTYSYTINETTGDVTATWTTLPITGDSKFEGYAAPQLNVTSCTSIGEVFGGGYGATAIVYGNPTVNINMIPGAHADEIDRDGNGTADGDATLLGEIGDVYGGGDAAAVYGNTTVNIGTATSTPVHVFVFEDSEYKLQYESDGITPSTTEETVTGAYITGNVYGGGKLADVTENTFVNVCAVKGSEILDGTAHTGKYNYSVVDLATSAGSDYQGVTIGGNVYGGGKGQAMMEKGTAGEAFLCAKAMVGVDGAGIEDKDNNGKADHPEGGTTVVIANGTVGTTLADGTLKAGTGYVYGGGEVGRVEKNTNVTIGIGNGTGNSSATSKPVILGNVFGAGAGKNTHGYSALVRGTSTVLVEGDAKVMGSVYGGGEKASVGRYRVGDDGLPQVLNNALAPTSGYCYVTIRGYAEIGPDGMIMNNTTTGKPDDAGHVFGACQGVLPYQDTDEEPKHMDGERQSDGSWEDELKTYPAYNASATLDGDYEKFIKSLALATQTLVTIEGNAFVKGSVYGGSENGFVQEDTHVTIQDDCQIGNGYVQMDDDGNYLAAANRYSVNRRYTDAEWSAKHLIKDGETNYTSSLPECASWPYGQAAAAADRYAPYDKDANTSDDLGKYANGNSTEGGRAVGDDGHTFFGNVFGGGSGYYPYRPGRWFEDAGAVYGNTVVDITGGHILTNIYGGNELTDVSGKCTVNFGGTATLGVPRTLKQIDAHPVTCYLFGAGKGDPRVLFNKSTNVEDVEVNITGGTIYGSVFGGGEDGHVLRDVTMTIGKVTTTGEGDEAVTTRTGPTIGTWGTSYVDGNVFGGGRGFSGDAYTAGNVAGSVTMTINGGTMLGSVYGGGRLGSVGYGLFDKDESGYGEMRADDATEEGFSTSGFFTNGRGHIDITINGGTIGNTHEYIVPSASNIPTGLAASFSTWTPANWTTWKEHNYIPKTEFDTATGRLSHTKGGNVFAGGMGRMYQLDGSTPIPLSTSEGGIIDWFKLGRVKSTTLTINGGIIKSCVYGGGELGWVSGTHSATIGEESKDVSTDITITNGTIGTVVTEAVTTGEGTSDVPRYTFGSVFGGGFGSAMEKLYATEDESTYTDNPKFYAGRVVGSTKIDMSGGKVLASIYGGGETASVGLGTTYGEAGETDFAPANVSTNINITGGEVGKNKEGSTYFGGATMGNVYGGGCGTRSIVRCGLIFGNANVNISGNDTKIYHNVYGGGAFGSVGDFSFHTEMDNEHGTIKVTDIDELATAGTGIAKVTISGGTIGTDGYDNGMVFGSSRGEVQGNAVRDDYGAWVYNANVTIGVKDATTGAETGPTVKGSVYGSGENGHVFNNTEVTVNGGTIGIATGEAVGGLSGAAYPYRGNVYGGGCGTDMYDSDNDGTDDAFKPLAGVVYGTTTVNIKGGTVVRNVYGAGAMGSVGKAVTANDVTTVTGGTTTINVSGGTIGASGTVGDGNVFGAARGSLDATGDDLARVFNTSVTVSNGLVKGNVYGGGELGDVGFIDKSDTENYNYLWKNKNNSANTPCNNTLAAATNNNTGICTVSVSGGTIGTGVSPNVDGTFANGNVYGGGKGSSTTWWCEKAIAYATDVTVSAGIVKGTVYGGGEVGRVEDDSKVTIGAENATGNTPAPTITGNVFGAGAGINTHGYSALVRGNAAVTVQGTAQVGGSVYGGGEIASVGKFVVDRGLPKEPKNGGTCTVIIQDNAKIGTSGTTHNVYGACKGVTPAYNNTVGDENRSKSMQLVGNAPADNSLWSYYNNDSSSPFIWRYYATETDYLDFLKTLALTSNTHVTIDDNANVYGSVFGGGERGVTLGGVDVNMTNGTVHQDVYGGGSLADSNAAMWDAQNSEMVDYVTLPDLVVGSSATGYYTAKSSDALITATDATVASGTTYYAKYKTNVNLLGGTVVGDAYGGGLGRLAKDPVAEVLYTAEDEEVIAGTKQVGDVKVAAQAAVTAVEAKVYGDVLVELNGTTTKTTEGGVTVYGTTPTSSSEKGCTVGRIFGCNNLNGSPKGEVLVHVHATQKAGAASLSVKSAATKNSDGDYDVTSFDVKAVYGGGNMAAYDPVKATGTDAEKAQAYTNVIIDGCDLTSIGQVYGGGNAASAPATEVTVNGTYEIGDVFGGGNGKDAITVNGVTMPNPGANVGYGAYDDNDEHAQTPSDRDTYYGYGTGVARTYIYGGTIHSIYGGSNSKGNIRTLAHVILDDVDDCSFNIGEAFGGGKNANMDGEARLEIRCISQLGAVYGGAENADVLNNVTLNITNGTYDQVFGGNKSGGRIGGAITVNVEETGCKPVIIGELYAGGNLAAYSKYGYKKVGGNWEPRESSTDTGGTEQYTVGVPFGNPTLNVKSFTSIGAIYGGGYGSPAKMVADPTVKIDVVKGKFADDDKSVYAGKVDKLIDGDHVTLPAHEKGKIGAIWNVFGGGNQAEVIGSPNVLVGTQSTVRYVTDNAATEDVDETEIDQNVVGVKIIGNVFGGGNNANVTGNPNVVIGRKKQ